MSTQQYDANGNPIRVDENGNPIPATSGEGGGGDNPSSSSTGTSYGEDGGEGGGAVTPTGGSPPPPAIEGDTNGDGILSYDEWFALEEKRAATWRDSETNRIDEQTKQNLEAIQKIRDDSYKQAEIDRERGVVDAATAAAQNKASYGANAERMAAMGLTGSGYGEYMDAQSYAAQRAEAQAWNANVQKVKREADLSYSANALQLQSNASDAKAAAEKTYNDRMSELGKERAAYDETEFNDLLSKASNGTYTAEQVTEIARQKGYSEARISTLTSAANKYASDKALSDFITLLDSAYSGTYDAEAIGMLAGKLNLSSEDTEYLKNVAQTLKADKAAADRVKSYLELLAGVNNGQYSYEEIASIASSKGLTEEEIGLLESAANKYASDKALSDFSALLDAAYSGTYDAEAIGMLAGKLNLSSEDTEYLKRVAQTLKDDQAAADRVKSYLELLTGVKNGQYSYEEIESIASSKDLTGEEIGLLQTAANKYASDKALSDFNMLLTGINNGTYTEEDIKVFADKLELGEDFTKYLLQVAGDEASKAHAETLLSLSIAIKTGEIDAAMLDIIAGNYGITDEDELEKLREDAAAYEKEKALSRFMEILNGINSGTYDEATVDLLCKQLGIDSDDELTGALKDALQKVQDEQADADARKDLEIYIGFLSDVKNGLYTSEELEAMDWDSLFSDNGQDYIDKLKDAAALAEKKKKAAAGAALLENLGDNIGAIKVAIEAGDIDPEVGEKAIEAIQDERAAYFLSLINTASFDPTEVIEANKNGYLRPDQFAEIKKEAVDNLVKKANNGTLYNGLELGDAVALFKNSYNTGWISKNQKSTLLRALTKAFPDNAALKIKDAGFGRLQVEYWSGPEICEDLGMIN